jgi:energy-converting hydrogenase A subunit R
MKIMGGNDKALALMEMRRRTNVDLDCTAYIGSNATDYPVMDIVSDNGGLSISFNGDAYAVRGCSVAVMSPNPIVAAVLISEFYTEGMEGIFSLVGSWDRNKLSKREHSDRHLMNAMLRTFPSKLPDVVIVDDNNLDEVAKESERYRRKMTV